MATTTGEQIKFHKTDDPIGQARTTGQRVNFGRLAEAKALVEGAPKTVREGATKEEAEDIKKKLEAAGAKAEIK